VQPDAGLELLARVPSPRSSTHCELVALGLGLTLETEQLLTDFLTALGMLKSWAEWPAARVLSCGDRVDVRRPLHLAGRRATFPMLEKVKAHDERAIDAGVPKGDGNDAVDQCAKRAATEDVVSQWGMDGAPFRDPVEVVDTARAVALDVSAELGAVWWRECRGPKRRGRGRGWLNLLHPEDVAVDVAASMAIFRQPIVNETFVHRRGRWGSSGWRS